MEIAKKKKKIPKKLVPNKYFVQHKAKKTKKSIDYFNEGFGQMGTFKTKEIR